MKNIAMQNRLEEEILSFIQSRKTLQLASITETGDPFASYAPFAIGNQCLYVLLSDIAIHALNLKANNKASALIIEDEESANELFARVRVNYQLNAKCIELQHDEWEEGIQLLVNRHGQRSKQLSELDDFNLFKLTPTSGRYVKG